MRIVMYTEGLPFNGDTIRKRSLGGSETAAYYMCRELAKRGHDVTLFCNFDKPENERSVWSGVTYRSASEFVRFMEEQTEPLDVLICSRHLQHLLNPAVDAKAVVVWNHDIVLPEAVQYYHAVLWKVDCLLFNSEFHRDQADSALGGFPDRLYLVSRNGVDLSAVRSAAKSASPRDPNKVIYTSRPDRGLDVLLAAWPRIKHANPSLTLEIAYYSFPQADQGSLAGLIGQLDARIAQLDGVTKLKAMPKRQLYQKLMEASALAYPSIFWETSCIAAIEAMACGTPVVTSKYCALKETVGHMEGGVLVPGWPRIERGDGGYNYAEPHTDYQKRYTDWLSRVLTSPSLWEQLHRGALARAERYDYPTIAKEWEGAFEELVACRSHKQTVTACMIVRDGEAALHRTMKSIKDQVDAIRVRVDSRTADSTRDIAKLYTHDVEDYEWDDATGFSGARNLSIEGVETDWVLWIDSDEVLQGDFRRYLRHNGFNSYILRQVHLSPHMENKHDTPARLFRAGIGAQFLGLVHEQPETVLNKGVPRAMMLPDVLIAHDGYSVQAVVDEKWDRNHALSARDVQANPLRDISWFGYLRDCVIVARREVHKHRQLTPAVRKLIEEQVFYIWDTYFSARSDFWNTEAMAYYQEALTYMGCPEFAISFVASKEGLPEKLPEPHVVRRRFRSQSEMRAYLEFIVSDTEKRLNPPHPCPFEER